MNRRYAALLIGVALITLLVLAVTTQSRSRETPERSDLTSAFQNQLASFNASHPSPEDIKALETSQERYKSVRERALSTIESKTTTRKILSGIAHLLSGLVLAAAFWISLLGASKGVQINGPVTSEQLKQLGKFRKHVLIFTSASALCAGAADRVSAYSSTVHADVRDIVALINKANDSFSSALGPKDVEATAAKLELDLAEF